MQGIIKRQASWCTGYCSRFEASKGFRSVTRAQGHLPRQNESGFHHLKVVLHLHSIKLSAFISAPLYYHSTNSEVKCMQSGHKRDEWERYECCEYIYHLGNSVQKNISELFSAYCSMCRHMKPHFFYHEFPSPFAVY